MKNIILLSFFIIKIFALSSDNPLLLGDLKQIEKNFIKEYPNEKLALNYVKKLNDSEYLLKIKEILNSKSNYKQLKFHNKIYYKPNYEQVFNIFLKHKNNPATSYVATQLFILVYGLYNKEKVKRFLKPFSKVLYQNSMCSGYLFYGDSLRLNLEYVLARKVYKEGKTKCNIDWLKTYIIGRLLKYY